jgi:hypothetical protein
MSTLWRLPGDVESAIHDRAAALLQSGEWLGLFDLAVHAHASKVRLMIFFGDDVVDLLESVNPTAAATLPADCDVHWLVATTIDHDEVWAVHYQHCMNHWIAAISDGASHPHHTALEDVRLDARLQLGHSVREHYREKGFLLHDTIAQGDCGPDACLITAGLPRGYVAVKAWRLELFRAMVAVAADPTWQQSMQVSSEYDPPAHSPPAPSTAHPLLVDGAKDAGAPLRPAPAPAGLGSGDASLGSAAGLGSGDASLGSAAGLGSGDACLGGTMPDAVQGPI